MLKTTLQKVCLFLFCFSNKLDVNDTFWCFRQTKCLPQILFCSVMWRKKQGALGAVCCYWVVYWIWVDVIGHEKKKILSCSDKPNVFHNSIFRIEPFKLLKNTTWKWGEKFWSVRIVYSHKKRVKKYQIVLQCGNC